MFTSNIILPVTVAFDNVWGLLAKRNALDMHLIVDLLLFYALLEAIASC